MSEPIASPVPEEGLAEGVAVPAWDEQGSWLDNLASPELGPVSWLGELAPSGRLMGELEALPADMVADDHDAIEMVAHWKRLEAYCALRVRLAAAAVARRQSMAHGLSALLEIRKAEGREAVGRGGVAVDVSVAADELGLRLGVSKLTAKRLIASGQSLRAVGMVTGEALAAGQIDASKADLIVDAVADLPPEAALEVQERVLERAAHLPPAAVRREVNAACAGVDVAEYENRCRAERAKRRVCRPRALPHGMAGLYAVLPAADATQLYRAVDAAARSAKAAGDGRTMDQLRADALGFMGSVAVKTGWIGSPGEPVTSRAAPAGTDAGRALEGRGPGEVRDGPETGRGAEPRADRPAGSGPHTARADTGDVCPRAGMPVGAIGGRSAHVRVVVPMNVLMAQEAPHGIAGRQVPGGVMAREVDVGMVGGREVDVGMVGGDDVDVGGSRTEVDVAAVGTGPFDPALGVSEALGVGRIDAPAHLEGYGPIPGSVARALAAGSTWARLVTDPVDGSVRELSAATYRPPPALADLVRVERPVCIRPGCSVEADSCDLNHFLPWPIGATEFDNLDPMCRRDHELITHAGWSYENPEGQPGVGAGWGDGVRWTTASGYVYVEQPGGAIQMSGSRAAGTRLGCEATEEPPSCFDAWAAPPF